MEDNKLQSEQVPRLLWTLAVPAICAQLITLFYNLVDRIFIGRMADGILAMGAIGVCAPIVTVVSAFTGLFGRGGAPLAAIHMGRDDREGAEQYLGTSFSMLTITSVLLVLLVLAGKIPLLRIFGASERMLPFADQYISIYCLGTPFLQITVGMNAYITTQGFAKTAMVTTALGGVLNIILDPILIFGFGMGVRGAALATVLSQFISFLWVLRFLFGEKTQLRLTRNNMVPQPRILREIVVLGSASFFMNLSEGAVHICFNNQVLRFGGDTAVSAMTILFSLFQFMLLPVEGVAQGSQPIISYNYGAGQFARVKETIRIAAVSSLFFTVCATSIVMAAPEFFIRIFNSDTELLSVGRTMLRVYAGGLFILGANSTWQQTYNALGEGKKAFSFAFFRKAVLLLPLIYLFPRLLPWDVLAVMLAEPVSDILTTAVNTLYFRRFIRRKLHTKAEP